MMSEDRITRREALTQVATLLGTAISAPTLAGALDAATRSAWAASVGWLPRTLTPEQLELVAVLADHIIPATDTPGARAVGVHRFVDVLLTDHYAAEERDRFIASLTDLQRQRFVETPPEQQVALLKQMDRAAYPPGDSSSDPPAEGWFFRRMKEVTLVGYYTSQIGAARELRVNPMGMYRGDVPFPAGGREWS